MALVGSWRAGSQTSGQSNVDGVRPRTCPTSACRVVRAPAAVVIFIDEAILFYRAQSVSVSTGLMLGPLLQLLAVNSLTVSDLHDVPIDVLARLVRYVDQSGELVYLDGGAFGFEVL
jgi:hypothetical protein